MPGVAALVFEPSEQAEVAKLSRLLEFFGIKAYRFSIDELLQKDISGEIRENSHVLRGQHISDPHEVCRSARERGQILE